MSAMETDKTNSYQDLIRHAIRALGFSREERDLKIEMVRRLNLHAEANGSCLKPKTPDVVFTGSFADGLNFETSDLDVIRRMPGFKILSNFILPRFGPQIAPENIECFAICGIEYEHEFPCYVRLPILMICSTRASEFTHIKCLKTYYLQNTFIRREMFNIKKFSDTSASLIHKHKFVDNVEYNRNGPAIREEFNDPSTNFKSQRDLVLTLFFDEWPCIATEFLNRKRCKLWPSEHILHSMKTKGCDLAAVGHTDSHEKDLLWRISFCGERDLFKSLNEIQIHCFLLMKIILKDDMPLNKEKDIISSFHLKNVIYWCIERSSEPWSCENFLFAFKRCLYRLMDFLFNRYLPYYIIPGRNLFNSRFTDDIAEKLIQVCKKYSDNPMNILLLKSFDELFMKNGPKMDLSKRINNLNIAELKLLQQRSIIRQCFSNTTHLFVSIQGHEYWNYLTPWIDVNGGIENWTNMYKIMSSGCKPYMEYELKYLECMIALMFYARYKQMNDVRDLGQSKSLTEKSLDLRISSASIRAASFYYMEDDFDTCSDICKTFLEQPPRFRSDCFAKLDHDLVSEYFLRIRRETDIAKLKEWKRELLTVFELNKEENVPKAKSDIFKNFNSLPYTSFKDKYIAVVYVTAEKWAVPEVVLYELLSRSIDSDNDYYRQFAGIFVDPVFNAWLLLYLCSLNRKDNVNPYNTEIKNNALKSMKSSLDEDGVQPRYQYCNIYSYCLLKSDLKVEAVIYILKSLCNYPSIYNAAFGYLRAIVHVLQQIA